jgi:hypothetical protein
MIEYFYIGFSNGPLVDVLVHARGVLASKPHILSGQLRDLERLRA